MNEKRFTSIPNIVYDLTHPKVIFKLKQRATTAQATHYPAPSSGNSDDTPNTAATDSPLDYLLGSYSSMFKFLIKNIAYNERMMVPVLSVDRTSNKKLRFQAWSLKNLNIE